MKESTSDRGGKPHRNKSKRQEIGYYLHFVSMRANFEGVYALFLWCGMINT